MKRLFQGFLMLGWGLAVLGLSSCDGDSSVSSTTESTPETTAEDSEPLWYPAVAAELIELVNQERAAQGLNELVVDDRLGVIMEDHTIEMGVEGRSGGALLGLSHDNYESRFQAAYDLGYLNVSENVGAISGTVLTTLAEVFYQNFSNSADHYENLIGDFTHTGAVVYRDPESGVYYASQFFAKAP